MTRYEVRPSGMGIDRIYHVWDTQEGRTVDITHDTRDNATLVADRLNAGTQEDDAMNRYVIHRHAGIMGDYAYSVIDTSTGKQVEGDGLHTRTSALIVCHHLNERLASGGTPEPDIDDDATLRDERHDDLRRDGQRWAASLTTSLSLLHAQAIANALDGDGLHPDRRAFCEGVRDGLAIGYDGLTLDTGYGERP